MKSASIDFCRQISADHARINLALNEELGWAHGLSYQDFIILTRLAQAPQKKLPASALMVPLGLPLSGVMRLLLPLEKTGLLQRQDAHNTDGQRVFKL